jgi:hypothetical protein
MHISTPLGLHTSPNSAISTEELTLLFSYFLFQLGLFNVQTKAVGLFAPVTNLELITGLHDIIVSFLQQRRSAVLYSQDAILKC